MTTPGSAAGIMDPSYYPAVPLKQERKVLPGNSDKFRQIVIQVQKALSLFGYYDGVIDGKIGPQSKVALAKLQEDYGLKVTGTITPEVLNSLNIRAY
ncbi:peptidoglycan-binding protein [Pararhizobium sp. DWP3-4]|uniref:peptidoglycan-binding protein n=1 Tax=Pararhizobium sp. DWP3-4 TaxID=2804565 RepID=UPI003CEA2FDD